MVTTSLSVVRNAPTASVYTRQDLFAGSWTLQKAFEVECTKSTGTTIGRASFMMHRGKLMFPGEATFTVQGEDLANLIGYWVKIEADVWPEIEDPPTVFTKTKFLWYGVITDYQQIPNTDDNANASDDFRVICHDLKWLLTRVQLTKSKVVVNGVVEEIQRAVTFNQLGSPDDLLGNKDASFLAFAEHLTTRTKWRATDILDYLLAEYPPTSTGTWQLEAATNSSLEWHEPTVRTEGRTLFDVVNDCIPKNRGLTWTLELTEDLGDPDATPTPIPPDPTQNVFEIRVHSYLDANLLLPGGGQIDANTNAVSAELNQQNHLRSFVRRRSSQNVYDRVVVRGQRRGAVIKLVHGTDFVNAWSAADETAYADGAKLVPAYSAVDPVSGNPLEHSEKARMNDSARMNRALNHVYTSFVLKDNWTGPAGLKTATWNGISSEYWQYGIRFEEKLPLYSNKSYANPSSPVSNGQDEQELLDPIVIIALEPTDRFERVDALASSAFSEYFGAGINWTCDVIVSRNRTGFIVRPTGPPHLIAKNHFTATEPTDFPATFDYTTLEATVYILLDDYCQGEKLGSTTVTGLDSNVLTIDIGSNARLDWMDAGVAYAVDGGDVKRSATAGFINDDTQLCDDLAAAAMIVYGTEREAISFALDQLSYFFPVGYLLTTYRQGATSITVNTLITSVTLDFSRGTTEIETSLSELDVRALL